MWCHAIFGPFYELYSEVGRWETPWNQFLKRDLYKIKIYMDPALKYIIFVRATTDMTVKMPHNLDAADMYSTVSRLYDPNALLLYWLQLLLVLISPLFAGEFSHNVARGRAHIGPLSTGTVVSVNILLPTRISIAGVRVRLCSGSRRFIPELTYE
jgi:hypothetical protein